MPAIQRAHWAAALCFALFALLQVNDADPVAWVAIYGVAAVLSGLAGAGHVRRAPSMVLSLATLVWGGDLAYKVWNGQEVAMVEGQEGWLNNELAREAFGLWMVSAWMGVVVAGDRR